MFERIVYIESKTEPDIYIDRIFPFTLLKENNSETAFKLKPSLFKWLPDVDCRFSPHHFRHFGRFQNP